MLSSLQRSVMIAFLLAALLGIGWLSGRNSAPTGSCGCGIPLDERAGSMQPPVRGNRAQDKAVANPAEISKPDPVAPGIPRLVGVGATTCLPCKMMSPILEELAREYEGKLLLEFIDISVDSRAAQRYRVRAIPTQVFYDGSGREFFRHMGFYSKEDILAKLREHGMELDKGDSE